MPHTHRDVRTRGRAFARAVKDKDLSFYRSLHDLIEKATAARRRAKSYRQFDVGAAAIGIMPDGTQRIFIGANKKQAKGPRRDGDECAEMEIIDAARKTKCGLLAGFVVIAPHQPDDASGLDLGATLSCCHCRDRFKKELADTNSPLKPFTRMMFVNADNYNKRPELSVEKVMLLCENA